MPFTNSFIGQQELPVSRVKVTQATGFCCGTEIHQDINDRLMQG